ncbi:hypothetical protein ACH5AJ_14890 [Streptomyces rochei]|uniref:hypothetical protein n=1 Tax=Streptomyces TaxID=1883 RepID=UPI00159CFF82|nr:MULTISPECIES: hypothetical protein [unclassified Streptomyces]MBJ6622202.1 hypothetical protein [Streptomyces sp. DHE17-7]GGZ82009.1 hypothetical protein GCM10010301_64060 [Streptomyces plicatus]GHC36601.1 hypothetical protein GCM10010308_63920 [Streptomyces vinaceusdrappus]
MPYGSIVGPGSTLAATGLATGQIWLVVASVIAVLVGAIMVRVSFRRGKGPVEQ